MEKLLDKIQKINELREEIDAYIWSIFNAYIKQEKILFSDPDNWNVDEESIEFYGSDGCMGCYNNKSISVPFSIFIDPENELLRLKNERSAKDKACKARAKKVANQKDRREFERLKKKFT